MFTTSALRAYKDKYTSAKQAAHFAPQSSVDRMERWIQFFDGFRDAAQFALENSTDDAQAKNLRDLLSAVDYSYALFAEQLTAQLVCELPKWLAKQVVANCDTTVAKRFAFQLQEMDVEGFKQEAQAIDIQVCLIGDK